MHFHAPPFLALLALHLSLGAADTQPNNRIRTHCDGQLYAIHNARYVAVGCIDELGLLAPLGAEHCGKFIVEAVENGEVVITNMSFESSGRYFYCALAADDAFSCTPARPQRPSPLTWASPTAAWPDGRVERKAGRVAEFTQTPQRDAAGRARVGLSVLKKGAFSIACRPEDIPAEQAAANRLQFAPRAYEPQPYDPRDFAPRPLLELPRYGPRWF